MVNITKEEALEEHRKMWNWIANETIKQKRKVYKKEYFEAMGIPMSEKPIYGCYCCEYSKKQCDLCPVKWPTICGTEMKCINAISLYYLWYNLENDDYKKASKYAKMIANLPERL